MMIFLLEKLAKAGVYEYGIVDPREHDHIFRRALI